jgi:hypothetical protein
MVLQRGQGEGGKQVLMLSKHLPRHVEVILTSSVNEPEQMDAEIKVFIFAHCTWLKGPTMCMALCEGHPLELCTAVMQPVSDDPRT